MLSLQHLYKTYAPTGQTPIWLAHDLSLKIPTGDTVALLGRSGCGKSTLLKIIAGLQAADRGAVWFDGQDMTDLPPEQRHFAMMFQDFALFPHLNVQDNVAFGLVEQRIKPPAARAQAVAMLDRFGLAAQAKSRVTTLSGGEQQRVALARALITQPRLLLLDEPFSALDADLKASLRQEFMTHIQNAHITTLLVTHDETEARAMARTGYRLDQGLLKRVW